MTYLAIGLTLCAVMGSWIEVVTAQTTRTGSSVGAGGAVE